MVHFIRYDSAALFYSGARCTDLSVRVTPFGNPRIKGYVLLPAAFRSLSRPSSSASSKASAMDLYSLDHIIFPRYVLSFRRASSFKLSHRFARPYRLYLLSTSRCSFPCYCQRSFFMGQNRVELLTPALSERCSNQLSYCPKQNRKITT